MAPRNLRPCLLVAALACACASAATACFVSIDESLLDTPPAPLPTGSQDSSADAPDADALAEALDAKPDADTSVDGPKPEADAPPPDALSEDAPSDAAHEDAAKEAAEAGDAPDGADAQETADATDADAGADADAHPADADAGPTDAPLVECADDAWCPPIGCSLRKCTAGKCVSAGTMKEDVATFALPAALACNASASRSCVVAIRSYLVALTSQGWVVFNARNPLSVRQEALPGSPSTGHGYLVRSGLRAWSAAPNSGSSVALAWLDLPLDSVGPLTPLSTATVVVASPSTRLAAPNDALYLFSSTGTPPGFARYAPGLPTMLDVYPATGAVEPNAVAVSTNRALMQERVTFQAGPPAQYHHHFSLQSDVTSSQSANGGTLDVSSLTTTSTAAGYYASSRSGAIAWVIGVQVPQGPQLVWSEVRAFWLVANGSSPVKTADVTVETYGTSPSTQPDGPVAFIDDSTIATAVISAGSGSQPTLDVVRRTGSNPPSLIKRIPLSTMTPGGMSVAGDDGYAYVVKDTTVRMFAPTCNP
jgi:hypothetical protein